MGPKNGINPAIVSYFSLEEYIDRIYLKDNVLFHLEYINKRFDSYLKKITQYTDYSVIYYWLDSLSKEIKCSEEIENHFINPADVLKNDVFFDNTLMSHARIKRLHQFVLSEEKIENYRTSDEEVRVSYYDKYNDEEVVYWNGALGSDVKKFMDDFIKIYKCSSVSFLHCNPFLKGALCFLLFIRIHPFLDGNGRTGRMIYNIKFTDLINKIYGTNLKLCPLNISQGILLFKPTYVKRLDDIYFDLEHDCNDEINKWFDFILNIVDDVILFNSNRISSLEKAFDNLEIMKDTDSSGLVDISKKMKITRFRN